MGEGHSAEGSDPRDFHNRARQLTELWKQARVYEYRRDAQSFINDCRDIIRERSRAIPLSWYWRKCLHDLVVVHHRLGDSREEILVPDENLLINLYSRQTPTDTNLKYYLFKKHSITSDIHKRRAFQEARRGHYRLAAERMEEAARAARQAITPAREIDESTLSPPHKPKEKAATKHLRYVDYHAAIFRLLASEASEDFVEAHAALNSARSIASKPDRPKRLFPEYIWDETDLDTYDHLIEAQKFLASQEWGQAISAYDYWLNRNQSHSGRFRFKNVKVRRHLAVTLQCLNSECAGCDQCRAARNDLQQLAQDTRIGDAGRNLAARGAALQQLRSVNAASEFAELRKRELLPILAYHWEPTATSSERDVSEKDLLPYYFTSLPNEAKRLAANGTSSAIMAQFVMQRLREFVEVYCEYEEGHIDGPHEPLAAPLQQLAERIVAARIQYRPKGPLGKGAESWTSAAIYLQNVEQTGYPDIMDRYHSILMKVAGLFPQIVRLRTKSKAESGQWTSSVETLDGDILWIKSDFELQGPLAYLSVRGLGSITLKRKDLTKWIPARAPEWIEIQSIKLWAGEVSRIGKDFECDVLDYKEALPSNIGKHLCAFCNSKGGHFVFGVKDPDEHGPLDAVGMKGLTRAEATRILDNVYTAASKILKPAAPVDFFRIYPDGVKLLLLCHVPASDLAPHKWQEEIYIRVASQSTRLSKTTWKWEDFARRRNMP